MKEHPTLFKREMILALLAGRKTQTRRILTSRNCTVNGYPFHKGCAWPWERLDFSRATVQQQSIYGEDLHLSVPLLNEDGSVMSTDDETRHRVRCKWSVGDKLWARETWKPTGIFYDKKARETQACRRFAYAADSDQMSRNQVIPWRPSIFMPRWASRITLQITKVRLERVQDISAHDSIAEGIESYEDIGLTTFRDYSSGSGKVFGRAARQSYETLWKSINGDVLWDADPWVAVIEFQTVAKGVVRG